MSLEPTHRLQLRTPEGVVFSLTLAGPVVRFLAWWIDVTAMVAGTVLLVTVASTVAPLGEDMVGASVAVAYFLLTNGYFLLTEWFWRGQTLGKKLLGLKVVDAAGLKLQWHQVLLRNLLRAVDGLPLFYAVGGVVSLFDGRGQRLGDKVAHTVVIRIRPVTAPELPPPQTERFNSLLDYPHLAARLRQKVSPELMQVAREAILRRKSLGEEARGEVFGELSRVFRQLVPFPAEASLGVSDEQYVRDVLEVVYGREASRRGRISLDPPGKSG